MRTAISTIALAFLLIPQVSALDPCWCPCPIGLGLCPGTMTVNSLVAVQSKVYLGGTPKTEKNGSVVCQGEPPAPTDAPTKTCSASVTSTQNNEVTVGSSFGTGNWMSVGYTATAGTSMTTACNASISSWCQCCICVCYIPKTVTTVNFTCGGDGCTWPVTQTDTATSYGHVLCTTTWDANNDGKDDCWNSMPNPCKTSCETGS